MSNAMFATLGFLLPMQTLLRRFGATARPAPRAGATQNFRAAEMPATASAEAACNARTRVSTRARGRAATPLRVVRVMEVGQAAALGGRMMISGRMADVCAELERMAEHEAALRTTN